MGLHRMGQMLLMGIAVSLFSVAAPRPVAGQGIGERIGEQLDQGINRLSSEVREGWASLRESVDQMGVQGRVYSRLRWDKHLADAEFDLDTREGGVVVLRGRVDSAEAKKKAGQLATDTIGVNRVVNELQVVEPTIAPEPAR